MITDGWTRMKQINIRIEEKMWEDWKMRALKAGVSLTRMIVDAVEGESVVSKKPVLPKANYLKPPWDEETEEKLEKRVKERIARDDTFDARRLQKGVYGVGKPRKAKRQVR